MDEKQTNPNTAAATVPPAQDQQTEIAPKQDATPAPTPAAKTYSRDDVNKIITAEVNKALEAERGKRVEAEKLAKMSADERLQHEREAAEKRAQAAEAELTAYRLRAEASKLAGAEGLPLEFLDTLDFRTAKAEAVQETVKNLASVFKAAVETALNERLKQSPPKTVAAQADTQRQTLEKAVADPSLPLERRVAANQQVYTNE